MDSSPWRMATVALMILWLGVILHSFGDYGMSWDEHYRQTEGAKKLVYYQNFFAGHWTPYDAKEDLYPGFYDLLHQGVNLISPLGLIPTGHLLTAIFAWIGVWGVYQLARRVGNDRVAFFAALFTITFPHFYGHAFINPKDIPFAACFIWGLYYIFKTLDGPLDAKLMGKLALTIGLTLGIRVGGVMLGAYLGAALICRAWMLRFDKRMSTEILKYIGFMAAVGGLAFLVLLPFWPYAHPDPLGTLFHTLGKVANFPWNGAVLFNGQLYAATDLPWYYLPEMLIITTPEFFLLLTVVGTLLMSLRIVQGLRDEGVDSITPRRVNMGFLIFTFIFPIAVVCIRSATLYDGIRHFLFVLPIWAILLAVVFDRLTYVKAPASITPDGLPVAKKISAPRWRTFLSGGMWIMLSISTLGIFTEYAILHPYQYTYYNRFVGGTELSWRNFETEYWGTSHREAVAKLVAHLKAEGDQKVHLVTSPMAPWLVENYLPANLVYTPDVSKADFFISFTRFGAHLWSDGAYMEDCIVARKGAPFAVVRDRRKIVEAEKKANARGKSAPRLISGILDLFPAF